MIGFYGNILTVIISFYVAMFILFKNKNISVNKWFIFFNLSIGLWYLNPILLNLPTISYEYKTWLQRIFYIFGIISIPISLKITEIITEKKLNKIKLISKFTSLILILLTFTPFFFKTFPKPETSFFQTHPALVYYIFVSYFILGIGFSLLFLIFNSHQHHPQNIKKQKQIKYLFIIYLFQYFGGAFYFISNLKFQPYFNISGYFSALSSFVLLYAIINYELVSITTLSIPFRLMLNRLFYIGFSAFIFVSCLFFSNNNPYLIFASIILLIIFLPPLKEKIMTASKKFILSKHGYLEKLEKATILNFKNFDIIYDLLVKIKDELNLNSAAVFVKENEHYVPIQTLNMESKNIEATDPLIHELKYNKNVILNKNLELVSTIGIDIIAGLYTQKNEILGFLFLGKKGFDFFDEYDLKDLKKLRKAMEKSLILKIKYAEANAQSQNQQQNDLLETTKKLIEIKDKKELAERIENFILKNIEIENINIFMLENIPNENSEQSKDIKDIKDIKNFEKIKYKLVTGKFSEKQISMDNSLVEKLAFEKQILNLEKLSAIDEQTKILLSQNKIQLALPLTFENLIGFILLENKKNNEEYNVLELQILNLIGYSSSIALQNIIILDKTIAEELTNFYSKNQFNHQLKKQIIFTIPK